MIPCEFCETPIPEHGENYGTEPDTFYYIVDWATYVFNSSDVCLSCAISNREMSLSPSSLSDVKEFLGE